MKTFRRHDYPHGWLVGDFAPSLFKSKEIEIGHLSLKMGHISDGHFHKLHTEYNYIVKGSLLVNGVTLYSCEGFIYSPMEKSEVEALEDTELIVIKTPATKNDKYYDGRN